MSNLRRNENAMPKPPSKSGFNKLLSAETVLLSPEPLIGLLTMETDTGNVELAINRLKAELLMSELIEFLNNGKGDDAPTFAVERSQ